MGFYTDWFIAEESDANAIASTVTTEEHSPDEWPHLAVKNIGEFELAALWCILLDQPFDPARSVSGRLLYQEPGGEGPFVSIVEPGFVDALAGIKKAAEVEYAAAWAQVDALMLQEPKSLTRVIRELSAFACRAR